MVDPVTNVVSLDAPKFTTDNLAESGLIASDFNLVKDGPPAIQMVTETLPSPTFGAPPLQLHGYSVAYPAPDHKSYIPGFVIKRFANHPEHKYEGPPGLQYLYWATEASKFDKSRVKFIVEGEKKALAFKRYVNAAAIGIRGCWGWVRDGAILPELAAVIHKGDVVFVLMDGDFITHQGIKQAAGTLARQIVTLGADAVFKVFPAYPSGRKMGADDWIMAQGNRNQKALRDAFDALPVMEWQELPEAAAFCARRLKLMVDGNGKVIRNEENSATLVKDLFGEEALFSDQYRGPMFAPWGREPRPYNDDTLDSELYRYIERIFSSWSKDAFRAQRRALVATVKRNLLGERLQTIQWDGKERIETMLVTHFGAEANQYTRKVSKGYCLGAIARLLYPGTKWDHVLILEGPQRSGKSYGLELLHYEYYANVKMGIDSDKLARLCCSVWCVNCDEMDHMTKNNREAYKSWVTERYENWVPKYVEYAKTTPRGFVITGTTNSDDYLNDPTGGQRYWPVEVIGKVDHDAIIRDRDQIWAEAIHVFKNAGPTWWAEFENDNTGAWDQQAKREENDSLSEMIEARLGIQNLPKLADGRLFVTHHWLTQIALNGNLPAAKRTTNAVGDAAKRLKMIRTRIATTTTLDPDSLLVLSRPGSQQTVKDLHFDQGHIPNQIRVYLLPEGKE